MKNLFNKIAITLILCSTLFACGSGIEMAETIDAPLSTSESNQPALATPQLSLNSSLTDVQNSLSLVGKFEVLPNPTPDNANPQALRSQDLEIKYIPVDATNPQAGTNLQVIPAEGLQLDDLPVGVLIFKITLSHRSQTQGDIVISSIETPVTIVEGQKTEATFASASWRYDFDDDEDGYANVTELVNGRYVIPDRRSTVDGLQERVWTLFPTDPKDANSFPDGVQVVDPRSIGTLPPDNSGNSRIIGDAHSVQPGVQVVVLHKDANGNIKATYTFYSRIDGSFEYAIPNAEQGDQIVLNTVSLPSLSENSAFSSLSSPSGENQQLVTGIQFTPVAIANCINVNARNAYPTQGFVEITGSGFASDVRDNIVIFPPFIDGQGIASEEVLIKSQTSRLTTLLARIPAGATSGYPHVLNKFAGPGKRSQGKCDVTNPLVVIQKDVSNQTLADLVPVYIEAPYVALAGDIFPVQYVIVNQGEADSTQNIPLEFYYTTGSTFDTSAQSIRAYPGSTYSDLAALSIENIIGYNLAPIPWGQFDPKKTASFSVLRADAPFIQGSGKFVKIAIDPISTTPGASRYGSVDESNDRNNTLTTDNQSYVHTHNLELYDTLGNKIDSSNSKVHVSVSNASVTLLSSDLNLRSVNGSQGRTISTSDPADSSVVTRLALDLKLGSSLNILLGDIKNSGTYPLPRQTDAQGRVYYSHRDIAVADSRVDDADPLDMLGAIYRNSTLLSTQVSQANDDQDLEEKAASDLLDQANALNDAVYPVRVRLVYSKDCNLAVNADATSVDVEINGSASEFCVNRLEAGEAANSLVNASYYVDNSFRIPNQISLQALLDQGFIREGTGCLYVLAEAVKTDPESTTARQSFCERPLSSNEARDNRTLLYALDDADRSYQTLKDFKYIDNVIQIPIDAKGVDFQFKNADLHSGTSANWNINSSVRLDYNVRNAGRLEASGSDIITRFLLSNVTNTNLGCDYLNQPPASTLNTLAPSAESAQNDYALQFNRSCLNNAQLWDAIPLGSTSINAIVDPVSTLLTSGNYFEVNASGTGESNNTASIEGIRIVAPDLKIYALGGAAVRGCNTASCALQTSLNSTLSLDVYVKNEGDGDAPASHLRVTNSGDVSCLSMADDAAVPALAAGQIARIAVILNVTNSYSQCANTSQNLLVQIDNRGALGEVIEKNALGTVNAEGNNTSISARVLATDTSFPVSTARDSNDPSLPSFTSITGVGEAGVSVNYEVRYVDLQVANVNISDVVSGNILSDTAETTHAVTYHIANTGTANSGRINISYELVPQAPILSGSTTIRLSQTTSIENINAGTALPGSTDTASLRTDRVRIPSGCLTACINSNQNYKLQVIATAASESQDPTADTANQSSTFKVRHYDLDLQEGSVTLNPVGSTTALENASEILKNQIYDLKFNVTKSGDQNALAVPYRVVLTQGSLDIPATVVNESGGPIIAPTFDFNTNALVAKTVRVKIPALNGSVDLDENLSYGIKVILNSGRSVDEEVSTSNNVRASAAQFSLKRVDLDLSAVSLSTEASQTGVDLVSGYSYTLNFTVRNAGTGRMQSASPLQVQACIDEDETPECGTWNDATPIPATTALQNLDAAATVIYRYSYRIPVNTTRGNKTLKVRINNNNNQFPEVNAESTSNTDEAPIVLKVVRLGVQSFGTLPTYGVSRNTGAAATVSVSPVISNSGNFAASNVTVRADLVRVTGTAPAEVLTTVDGTSVNGTIISIPAQVAATAGTGTVSLALPIPLNTPYGNYSIRITASINDGAVIAEQIVAVPQDVGTLVYEKFPVHQVPTIAPGTPTVTPSCTTPGCMPTSYVVNLNGACGNADSAARNSGAWSVTSGSCSITDPETSSTTCATTMSQTIGFRLTCTSNFTSPAARIENFEVVTVPVTAP